MVKPQAKLVKKVRVTDEALPPDLVIEGQKLMLLDVRNSYIKNFLTDSIKSKDYNEEAQKKKSLKLKVAPKDGQSKCVLKRKKRLTAVERKRLTSFTMDNSKHKYEMYIPLHHLWKDYMKSLCSEKDLSARNKDILNMILVKADYHGCILTVIKSKCPTYVDVRGIMLKETKNTFTLITKEDKLKVIPKQNSVFAFKYLGFVFTIFGNHFRIKSSERTAKKFKSRPTIDL